MKYEQIVSRFEDFVLRDDRRRWNCIFQSVVLALVYAVASDLMYRRPNIEITVGIVLIVGIYHAIYIGMYCFGYRQAAYATMAIQGITRLRFLRYAVAASGVALITTGQRVSAMITVSRMRRALENPLTPEKLVEVGTIANNARGAGIQVQRTALKEVAVRIADEAHRNPRLREPAQQALQAIASYSSTLQKPSSLGKPWSLYGRPTHEIQLQYPYEGPPPDTLAIGDMVTAPEAAYVLPLRTEPPLIGPEAILIAGKHPTNATTIKVDGYFFKNVIFQDCAISYSGGPVTIESAVLIDCSLGITVLISDEAIHQSLTKFFQDSINGPGSLRIP